ncbi:hypothetical protein V5799_004094 [Amblyomma americanum]|uniref:Uncharacterized protein n=1 Tax=Amblyomma americanum TaxID=6943 RepID=A0AAQ4D734_AMBAM
MGGKGSTDTPAASSEWRRKVLRRVFAETMPAAGISVRCFTFAIRVVPEGRTPKAALSSVIRWLDSDWTLAGHWLDVGWALPFLFLRFVCGTLHVLSELFVNGGRSSCVVLSDSLTGHLVDTGWTLTGY